MDYAERQALLDHLAGQVLYLAKFAVEAQHHPREPDRLIRFRDEIFTVRETLESLGVPLATASNDEWSDAIGTETIKD